MDIKKPHIFICLGVWLYLLAVLAAIMPSPLQSGTLVESDDYMRMVRVYDLLDGQAAVDGYTQPRLGLMAEGGAEVAWSRLADVPLAALITGFETFMSRDNAAMMTATVFPFVMLLLFIFAAVWYTRQGLPENRARWAPVTLLVLWGMLTQFFPGRVDHHSWQLIILVISFGCLLRVYKTPGYWRPAAAAGALMALSWSIGAEAVPWVALASSMIGFFWLLRGDDFIKPGLVFGGALLVATVILVPVTRDIGAFLLRECDAISQSYIALAVAVAVFWGGARFLPLHNFKSRLIGGGALALLLGAGLYIFMPDCFRDPYGVSDPELRRIWLEQVNEAKPALSYLRDSPGVLVFYLVPLLLALAASLRAVKMEVENRTRWLCVSFVMIGAIVLSLWQMRTAFLAQAIAILPLTWMLMAGSAKFSAWWQVRRSTSSSRKRLAVAGVFFAVMLALFGASLMTDQKDDASSATPIMSSCDWQEAAPILNSVAEPQTIAAYVIDGSELLFRTHHRVLAASYHRNAANILTAHQILMAGTDSAARDLVDQYDVGLIVVCRANLPYWNDVAAPAAPLAQRLWNGNTPYWLEPLGVVQDQGFRIFRVLPLRA